MDRLTVVIGPAPSERSKEDLIAFLRIEHARVSEGLATASAYSAKKASSSRVSATKARMKQIDKAVELDRLCKKLNKTPEEIIKLLEAQSG